MFPKNQVTAITNKLSFDTRQAEIQQKVAALVAADPGKYPIVVANTTTWILELVELGNVFTLIMSCNKVGDEGYLMVQVRDMWNAKPEMMKLQMLFQQGALLLYPNQPRSIFNVAAQVMQRVNEGITARNLVLNGIIYTPAPSMN